MIFILCNESPLPSFLYDYCVVLKRMMNRTAFPFWNLSQEQRIKRKNEKNGKRRKTSSSRLETVHKGHDGEDDDEENDENETPGNDEE